MASRQHLYHWNANSFGMGYGVGDTRTLSRESAFEILSNQRRRMVVHYLLKRGLDTVVELRDAAVQIAAWENSKTIHEIDSTERRRVYNALQQSHLPKMDDVDIIDFDASRGLIDPRDELTNLKVYLEVVPENDITWSTYYLLLAGLAGSLVLAVGLGVYPFSLLGGLGTASLLVVLLAVSAIVHVLRTRQNSLGHGTPHLTIDE